MCDIKSAIEELEKKLNLPKDFYNDLLKEDDWSFVIKISALFEAACTHGLLVKLPKIGTALKSIEHAHQKHGKITLLKELESINKEQAKFLNALAELRNRLAHDIKNFNFSFELHLNGLDTNQKRDFINIYGHGIHESYKYKGESITRKDTVLSNPKLSIWITAQEILACIYEDILGAEAENYTNEFIASQILPLLIRGNE